MRLAGKSALITGAARGIGRAFAEAYAREGATVAVADIDIDAAGRTAAAIGDKAYAIHLDVTDQASIDAAVAAIENHAGGVDILVNNAALFDLAPIAGITRASYDRLFAVNVAGTLFVLQAVARSMIARGKGGKIINMASQAGRRGEALVGEAVPYGRMGTAADLTGMAVFLASAESDYVVAQTYNVDGGNWMS